MGVGGDVAVDNFQCHYEMFLNDAMEMRQISSKFEILHHRPAV